MLKQGTRLRIYTTESAKHEKHCLYETILNKAHQSGLVGGTVFRGIAGFGHHGHPHTVRLVEMSSSLPVLIEIIDEDEKIETFLKNVGPFLGELTVTVENIQIWKNEK